MSVTFLLAPRSNVRIPTGHNKLAFSNHKQKLFLAFIFLLFISVLTDTSITILKMMTVACAYNKVYILLECAYPFLLEIISIPKNRITNVKCQKLFCLSWISIRWIYKDTKLSSICRILHIAVTCFHVDIFEEKVQIRLTSEWLFWV
jgi:hypothetical protein